MLGLRTITVELPLSLWTALLARTQMVESDELSLDGVAYYLSSGSSTGYAANPRRGSILAQTVFASRWMIDLVEKPADEAPADWDFIREELREALSRTTAGEACVRVVVE